MSSSQLTFTPPFFRGVGQPPTSCAIAASSGINNHQQFDVETHHL